MAKKPGDNKAADGRKTVKKLVPGYEKTKFTPENQPSPEAKSEGARRHWALKRLLSLSTGQKFEGSAKDYRDAAARYFQIEPEEVTVKMLMEFRQIEKAILKGDTQAFTAVMDRAFGKPKIQDLEDGDQDKPASTSQIDLGNGIIFDL
jgi:hypothetical protein